MISANRCTTRAGAPVHPTRDPKPLGKIFGDLIERVRVCKDSPLEGDGFELPVPRELISAGGRNPAASVSTSALDGATRAQLGGAERTVARKWRKTGIFPPFRDAPRVKSVVWRNQVSSKINGLV